MVTQTEKPYQVPATAADFKADMQAITTLNDKVDLIQTNVTFIRKDLDSFCAAVTEVKQRVSQTKETVHDHDTDFHTLKIRVKALEARAEDAKNRNRRNNLRIQVLPAGAENTNAIGFAECLLQQLLPSFFSTFCCEGGSPYTLH